MNIVVFISELFARLDLGFSAVVYRENREYLGRKKRTEKIKIIKIKIIIKKGGNPTSLFKLSLVLFKRTYIM